MNLLDFNLSIVFMTCSIFGPPSSWPAEVSQNDTENLWAACNRLKQVPDNSSSAEWSQNDTENLRAVYNRLKEEPGSSLLQSHNLRVANEDLEPQRKNLSDDVKIMLYERGYLKVEKRDELYTILHFPEKSDFRLYAHLVWITQLEDDTFREALYGIQAFFQRTPPEIDEFKSFMLALDTVLSRIPHLFRDWGVRAIFGTLYVCGLELKVGGSPNDCEIIYCDDYANNTIMRFVLAKYDRDNATRAWNSYYWDLMPPGLIDSPGKNLLAMVVTFFESFENWNSTIRDWFGVYETPEREVLREYRPGIYT